MNIPEGKIIELPKITDPRGNLTFAESIRHIPFEVKRVYWVYDVPSGENRGGHAHKKCREFIIAVSGSFTVTLDNGHNSKTYLLNHPYQGLLVETGTRSMTFPQALFVLYSLPTFLRKATTYVNMKTILNT